MPESREDGEEQNEREKHEMTPRIKRIGFCMEGILLSFVELGKSKDSIVPASFSQLEQYRTLLPTASPRDTLFRHEFPVVSEV